jgi:5-methyltetrahydrofolate--homocysteine methyltransferase
MRDFTSRLREGQVIVADGAMGTMLQKAGLPSGQSPEGWLLENPRAVYDVHRAWRIMTSMIALRR